MSAAKSSWKVIDILKIATDELKRKEIDNPRLNAELLLCDTLNYSRINLYIDFEKPLSEIELSIFREKLKRRLKYEPLQYIRGFTEFYGIKFIVDNSVLIPRPETELLVELVVNEIKNKNLKNVLEIGSGSGCISVSISKNIDTDITAIDISPDAVVAAKRNSDLNLVNNINFEVKDLFKDIADFNGFDIIVSNPPYVDLSEYNKLQKEITLYEPRYAVTDDKDGLSYYSKIAELAANTSGNIILFLEIGMGMKDKIENLLKNKGISNIKFHKDILGIDRVVHFTN